MNNKIIFILVFVCSFGFAQTHKATIENIEKDGFHKVLISPEVRSESHDNLDYFRIIDANKKEVPYVVFENSNRSESSFEKLEIISKNVIKDSLTSIVIKNYTAKNNDELVLQVSNTNINKSYNISGSNDKNEWFGLVSNQVLSNLNNPNRTFATQSILFPSNSYAYLKIDFKDKKSLPINVLNIGYYVGKQNKIPQINVDAFSYKISENKDEKKTIIEFTSKNNQRIDGISFAIADKLFSRNASIVINKTRKIKKRAESYKDEIAYFKLSSNYKNEFYLNDLFVNKFTIEIENHDNQPLQFSEITLQQNPLYVIADVKANQKYEVIIDTTLSKPNYDLANFKQNFSTELSIATISNIKEMNPEKTNASEVPFWQSKEFMWFCILIGIAIIGYFSLSLLKDMKKE